MNRFSGISSLLISFALLTACASNPRVQSDFDDSVDFSQYKTFNFGSQMEILDPDFHDVLGLTFSAAIEEQMRSRGYVKTDNPDVLINVSVDMDDKLSAPRTGHICPSYNDYYWQKPTKYYRYSGRSQARLAESRRTMCDYTEGSITIDVVDVKLNRSIWKGVSLVRIDEKERVFLLNGYIVNDIDGSIEVDMTDVKRRSTYTYDNSRLSDDEIDRGYLLKGYILDDVARMFSGSPFRDYQMLSQR